MASLYILGAGGHGRVVLDVATACGRWDNYYFLDDQLPQKKTIGNAVVAGPLSAAKNILTENRIDWIPAIGDNAKRLSIVQSLSELRLPVSLIHPSSVVSDSVEIDAGTIVMAGTVINCNSKIGKACIINTRASVDHDCALQDGVHLSPGVALGGGVTVGDYTWICIGASVAHGVNIGTKVVVAAGAAVTKNITSNSVVGGVPARFITESNP